MRFCGRSWRRGEGGAVLLRTPYHAVAGPARTAPRMHRRRSPGTFEGVRVVDRFNDSDPLIGSTDRRGARGAWRRTRSTALGVERHELVHRPSPATPSRSLRVRRRDRCAALRALVVPSAFSAPIGRRCRHSSLCLCGPLRLSVKLRRDDPKSKGPDTSVQVSDPLIGSTTLTPRN